VEDLTDEDTLVSRGSEEQANVVLTAFTQNDMVLRATLSTDVVEADVNVVRGDAEAIVAFAVSVIDAVLKQDTWVDDEWVSKLLKAKAKARKR
jgi:hypothetical protein